ncbi:pheromone alpha factor receptor [Purpureocillium takamizusanense]|uniref:Pheromone alpha factor receptor n=1 Tax=Purpureocillium takamizusanense TaxID=2060973 RepID=A0A9Q8Q9Z7_9HYPO|nr:pheromone alpha factor receptor [Purpureocillium takamizusanense]UNI15313.1 pheromone alpha factor receptor [Purpureocillium takamizusanense]
MSTSQPPPPGGGGGNNAAAAFDPYTQNVTFLGPDGVTPIAVPIPDINAFNDTTVAVTINYAMQMGCCLIMLLVLLTMTRPLGKLRRVSSMLYALGLATCIVRNAIFVAFFLSPLNHFYQSFAGDYSDVPRTFIANSVAGTVMSCLLVLVVEAALMNQAWTTVRLWAEPVRTILVFASGVVVAVAVAFRIGFLIVTARANVELLPTEPGDEWAVQGSLITLAVSVFWFCALFNLKLVKHLVTNWGVLPSMRTLTSMEVLIMTNGVLMIIPAIFAGLEWGSFQNFESQSLVTASVIILLPLGTLIAQQISGRSRAGRRGGGGGGGDGDGSGGYPACSRSSCSCGCHRSAGSGGSGGGTNATRGGGGGGTASKTMRTSRSTTGIAVSRTATAADGRDGATSPSAAAAAMTTTAEEATPAAVAAQDEKLTFFSALRLHSLSSSLRLNHHHHLASTATSPTTSTTLSAPSRHGGHGGGGDASLIPKAAEEERGGALDWSDVPAPSPSGGRRGSSTSTTTEQESGGGSGHQYHHNHHQHQQHRQHHHQPPLDQFDIVLRQIDSETDLPGGGLFHPYHRRDSGYPGGEGKDRDLEKGV